MRTKVRRWGNSLALRIPKSFAQETGVEDGTSVDLSVHDGQLVARPLRRGYRLEQLLAAVTRENLHGEVRSGGPRGRESW